MEEKKDYVTSDIQLELSVPHDFKNITTITSPLTGKETQGDVALNYVGETVEYTPEEERRLVRKIDFIVLPMVTLIVILQFVDKLTNNFGVMVGLREDLGMHGDMYSWVGLSFYLGYLAFEFIGVRCLQKYPLLRMLSIFIVVWGAILVLHAVPAYGAMITFRVLLGMFELTVMPGMVIIVGQWYHKSEQFLRTTIFYCSMGIGYILLSAMGYGVYVHRNSYAIKPWQVMYIVMGFITMACGVAFYFYMPDNPQKAWFLNDREKAIAMERARQNKQGYGNPKWKWYQFKEALLDFQAWFFFLFAVFVNIGNGAVTNFSTLLLKGMGFDTTGQILMNMPTGAIEFGVCVIFAYLVRWVKSRMAIGLFAMSVLVMANALLAYGPNNGAKYAGYILSVIFVLTSATLLSNVASNVAGHTKKITVNAMYLIGYCVGNLIGPQTMLASEEPEYPTGKTILLVMACLGWLMTALIWGGYWWKNQQKKKLEGTEIYQKFLEMENVEFCDFTDKENPLFRYEL